MQKNKIEYDQIINKFDKFTFDSLLDIVFKKTRQFQTTDRSFIFR